MKRIILVLMFAGPAFAEPVHFLTAQGSIQDTLAASNTCAAPTFQTGQKSAYWYIQCNGDDGSTPWAGGDFQWKFIDTVPADATSGRVHAQVVFESLYDVSGGGRDISFDLGAIVQTGVCNVGSAYGVCALAPANDPELTYQTSATNATTTGRCQGATANDGTADATGCTANATCTSTGQFCVSRTQFTAQDASPYTLQQTFTGDILSDCTVGSPCGTYRVVYTLQLNDANTSIERNFRVLGLLVYYNQ